MRHHIKEHRSLFIGFALVVFIDGIANTDYFFHIPPIWVEFNFRSKRKRFLPGYFLAVLLSLSSVD